MRPMYCVCLTSSPAVFQIYCFCDEGGNRKADKKSLKLPKGGNHDRNRKKNIQHNSQKKKNKRKHNDAQN